MEIFDKCNTFRDFYHIIKDYSKKEKGDVFENMTYFLFKLCPTLNNDLENIWLYKDIPANIMENLNLPNRDKGIDLLAKIKGEYYAIQCKFRQDIYNKISWRELSTFFGLSFGINNKIKRGILVTNTIELCDEVMRSEKVDLIYGIFFDNLPNNFFKNICNVLSGNKIEKYEKKLFKVISLNVWSEQLIILQKRMTEDILKWHVALENHLPHIGFFQTLDYPNT
jgi:hypothetical protein